MAADLTEARPDHREMVAVPPLTRAFNEELRRLDFREYQACIAACEAHLANLRREGKPLRSLIFRER